MKSLVVASFLLGLVGVVHGQPRYRNTESYPTLRVTAVLIPSDKARPLKIAFTLRCVGRTPVAVSQDQFGVSISTEEDSYLYFGDAAFASGSPKVFKLNSKQKITLILSTLKDRMSPSKSWGTLPPGKYRLRIYVNSGKMSEFDYQWLGQTYSNDYILRIP